MVLKRGSSGPEVKILQEQLNTVGVSCDIDGIFGPGTEKAVRTFQTAYGIDSDGMVGEHTRIKLAEALAAAGGAPSPARPAATSERERAWRVGNEIAIERAGSDARARDTRTRPLAHQEREDASSRRSGMGSAPTSGRRLAYTYEMRLPARERLVAHRTVPRWVIYTGATVGGHTPRPCQSGWLSGFSRVFAPFMAAAGEPALLRLRGSSTRRWRLWTVRTGAGLLSGCSFGAALSTRSVSSVISHLMLPVANLDVRGRRMGGRLSPGRGQLERSNVACTLECELCVVAVAPGDLPIVRARAGSRASESARSPRRGRYSHSTSTRPPPACGGRARIAPQPPVRGPALLTAKHRWESRGSKARSER